LRRVHITGGSPELICEAPNGRGGAWSRDGTIVFAPNASGGLFSVRAAGGPPTAVTAVDTAAGEAAHRWPQFLPDGEHFTYAALPAGKDGRYSCYVGSLHGHGRKFLLAANGAPVFAPPNFLMFLRGEGLVAQRLDLGKLAVTGDAFGVAERPAETIYTGNSCVSVSNNGVMVWQSVGTTNVKLVWVDRNGHEIRALGIPLNRWLAAVLTPDGKHALLEQGLPSGESDLWVANLGAEVVNRLTFGQARNALGTWSADGREVFYSSTRSGRYEIYRRAVDGSGPDQLLQTPVAQFKYASSCSPDGKWMSVMTNGDKDGWNMWNVPTSGGPGVPYIITPFDEQYGVISEDGKWCLYTSNESGSTQIYVQSFPTPGHKQQVSRNGGFYGTWAKGGREVLIYRPDGVLEAIPVGPGEELKMGPAHELFRIPPEWRFVVSPDDASRFLILEKATRTAPGISVAVNWMAGTEQQ
jgi:hypothetical protein